ncbi:MAG TPA: cupin domain-containing protein [Dehalococcoidia bacterium]|nr:cupin domain-containing protein [Dehalococcoidia bacterium]
MLTVAAVLFAATLLPATSSAADATQTTRLSASFPSVQLPGRYYDLNQNIGEFAPGAALPLQSCACEIYFTVIEGEITVTIGTKTEVYSAGKSANIPAGIMNQPVNNGSKQARVFYTMLQLAQGSDTWQFTEAAGAPKPSITPKFVGWSTVLGLYSAEAKVTVIQNITDWDSGFKTPVHVMNHDHVFSVLEGENTFRYRDGAVETYKAGQKAVMTKGRVGTMENSGGANNRMAISWVIASSAPPFSPV